MDRIIKKLTPNNKEKTMKNKYEFYKEEVNNKPGENEHLIRLY